MCFLFPSFLCVPEELNFFIQTSSTEKNYIPEKFQPGKCKHE